jgi:hypothetical protein
MSTVRFEKEKASLKTTKAVIPIPNNIELMTEIKSTDFFFTDISPMDVNMLAYKIDSIN